MLRRNFLFLLFLAGLSVVSGLLMSKASWIGRVGISLLHQEYNLLKIWWQGAIAVFLIFFVLFSLLHLIQNRLSNPVARAIYVIVLLLGIAGFYLTYDDFTNDFSHHLLKWRFHLGFYLIWVGWLAICIFFLLKKKPQSISNAGTGRELNSKH